MPCVSKNQKNIINVDYPKKSEIKNWAGVENIGDIPGKLV